jgi:hypothetical protein
MDNAKTILEKVKLFFNDLVAPAPVAAAAPPAEGPKEYELKGGGTVTIDKLEAGGVVLIDGNPALPGDLELADGTKITCVDNGVIEMVTPGMPVDPAAPPVEDMGAKFSAFENATNEKFASYSARFEAQEAQISKMSSQLGKANKVIEELLKLSQLIVDAPVVPADAAASRPTAFEDMTPLEKFRTARKKMTAQN